MNKKSYLDWLYYSIGKQYNFSVSYMWKDTEGNIKSTKWQSFHKAVFPISPDGSCKKRKKVWLFKNLNQRSILPNEVVLDLETTSTIERIIETLKSWDVKFRVFETGSRGYHVHIFFRQDLTSEEKLAIIKHFEADEQLANQHMVALEHTSHWKSHKIKQEVKYA